MKNKLYIAITGISLMFLSGCFEDPGSDLLLETDLAVTIADANETGKTDRRIAVKVDGQSTRETVDISIIGVPSATTITATLEVVTDPNDATEAIEGIDFTFPNGKDATIAAGATRATIDIDIVDDGLDPDKPLTITLRIAQSSVSINETYAEFTMNIIPICPPEQYDYTTLVGAYTVTSSGESTDDCPANNPVVDFQRAANITLNSETDTEVLLDLDEGFGGLYREWYETCFGYAFDTDITITVNKLTGEVSGDVASFFSGDEFSVMGGVNPCNGNILVTWKNAFGDTGENFYVKN